MNTRTIILLSVVVLLPLLVWGCGKKQTEEGSPADMAVNESNTAPAQEQGSRAPAEAGAEKTAADIEYTLVSGVHGPGEVHMILVG